MFSNSWKEATEKEIKVPADISYEVFKNILSFIYAGKLEYPGFSVDSLANAPVIGMGVNQISNGGMGVSSSGSPNEAQTTTTSTAIANNTDSMNNMNNPNSIPNPNNTMNLLHNEAPHVSPTVHWLLQLLRASDEFCIDQIKETCAERLCLLVDQWNVGDIQPAAEVLGAEGLVKYCEWVSRQKMFNSAPAVGEEMMGNGWLVGGSGILNTALSYLKLKVYSKYR
jgi:hypothetical protein